MKSCISIHSEFCKVATDMTCIRRQNASMLVKLVTSTKPLQSEAAQTSECVLQKTTPNNADNAADPTSAFSDLKFLRSCRRVFAANSVSTCTQKIATSYTQVIDWSTCQPIPKEPQSHIFSNDICAIQHTQCRFHLTRG